ncbi:ClbS/DfsB family four-helix bundle protein [Ktedonosporobacter rubrisoli]|uniref:ClbS/DfsB family four-helix bundle protein n=1 Tax=Ktedonosporobacter rubrisoli TaxID=2509675 RepID=A0A4P6JJ11_KTERU|nr:ClbS/DfsB family four-helix bundle protein [Ktedonosporobacter rubrisoli]QBD75087.1 ClbS/DfsB family four-helix bundle protein [Ktedonosporobacter rubrisoli]
MPDPTNKAELLEMVEESYAAFEALLAPLSEAQLSEAALSNGWSLKDILAHLAAWHYRAAQVIEAAQRNEQAQLTPSTKTDEEVDQFNHATFVANRSRPLAEVRKDFRSSYQRLLAATKALSEAALFEPEYFSWMKGTAFWQVVKGDTFGHYAEHKPDIEAWLARQRS